MLESNLNIGKAKVLAQNLVAGASKTPRITAWLPMKIHTLQ